MARRLGHFGRQGGKPESFSTLNVEDQESALIELAKIAAEDTIQPNVRRAAIKIANECAARDDLCELSQLFDAVKTGSHLVNGLEKGLKYMADPIYKDFFTGPSRLLAECEDGACAEDCDGHAMLMFALAGSLGFDVGLRAYKPKGASSYEHVYAVAAVPKQDPSDVFGLDTSADAGDSHAGWEPPEGEVVTVWLSQIMDTEREG